MANKRITLIEGYHKLTPVYVKDGLTAWKIKVNSKYLPGIWRFIESDGRERTYERIN